MQKSLLLLLICILSYVPNHAKGNDRSSSKPQWVRNGEQKLNDARSNSSYYFKVIHQSGKSLKDLRDNNTAALASYIGIYNKIEGNAKTEIETVEGNGAYSKQTYKLSFNNNISSNIYYARLVDEYWEYVSYPNGSTGYELYTLFAVAANENTPVFDDISTSTSYGVAPALMSIIPGLGQWYKGSKTKAICMFAAEAATVAGIVICDNQRASYIKKMHEQPKFAKEYNSKADNWETARNICIGAAVGVWIYNIIDAIAAKGARRVIVKRANGSGLSLLPYISKNASGVVFALNFSI